MSRFWNWLADTCWYLLLIAAGVAFVYICFLALTGCSSSPKLAKVTANVAACESAMSDQVFMSLSCTEAQLRIDVLLKTEPACAGFKPFDVCAVLNGDGGTQ